MAGLVERMAAWLPKMTRKNTLTGVGAPPLYGIGELGNAFRVSPWDLGWQRNLEIPKGEGVAAVYACVMLNARAVSQCHPHHIREDDDGQFEVIKTSPASRILREPNHFDTFHQLILNTVAEMLFEGESLWLANRDERAAIDAVYRIPRQGWSLHINPDSREIYYGISTNGTDPFAAPDYMVPARDVCHFRMHTPRHSLVGESSIKAAALAIGINAALSYSQLQFFSQMNRPSGVLATDAPLNATQIDQLREKFDEHSKRWAQGGMPILSNGLKFQPMGVAQSDAQLIEQQRMSVAEIARVFGVPLSLLSAESAAPQAGTEAMVSHWLSIGLGSVIESMERSLERLFRMPANDHIQLDPSPLLRADFETQISGLVKASQGGIMRPDEARKRLMMGPVPGGDKVFMQRQMVALDTLDELNKQDVGGTGPEPTVAPPEPPEPDADAVRAFTYELLQKKRLST